MSGYPGQDEDYARPLLSSPCHDIHDVRVMLSIVSSCFWNYYDAKENRGQA